MVRRVLASVLPLAIVAVSTGCQVTYRRDVEPVGTPARWQYDKGQFLRYDGYEQGETPVAGDLEIAISDYSKEGSPVTLRMVGVVHIADRDYYAEIQEVLDDSDLVLYEGVNAEGEPGTVDPQTRALWDTISTLLGFSAQTSVIRYDRENFKQCDLVTDAAFRQKTGGQRVGLVNPQMMESIGSLAGFKRQAEDIYPMDELEDYLKHTNAKQVIQADGFNTESLRDMLRQVRTVAETMATFDEQAKALADKLREIETQLAEMETLIIPQRNEYVMEKLAEELPALEAGGAEKVLSVFYGAGHMKDFDERLTKLGWERGEARWLKAWKMNSRE